LIVIESMELAAPLLSDLLAKWPVARLATVNENNQPHVVPIVFVAHEGCLWSPIDGKRKQMVELQRIQNLRGNANFSLILDQYDGDWNKLWWVRLDGRSEIHTVADQTSAQVTAALREKYPQYEKIPLFKNEPLLLKLMWTRATGWAQDDLMTTIGRALAARNVSLAN